jgi:endonuclease/exonuclease/phosphatase family metal-dependent hydrolase
MGEAMTRYYYVRALALLVILFLVGGCANFKNIRKVEIRATGTAKDSLTVMSFNIRIGYGLESYGTSPHLLQGHNKSLQPIVAAIQSVDPDIVGLQEVEGFGQAKRLAEALNMNFAFVYHALPGSSGGGDWWGVAILSKYKILGVRRHPISYGWGNNRSILICTVDMCGQPSTFVSIHKHFKVKDDSEVRNIMKGVTKIEGPVVLIGDLNLRPDDWRLKPILERFVDTAMSVDTESAKDARNTGTFLGIGRIDYVLVDSRYFEVQDSGIVSREYWDASDHLAYYARIILKPLP